jgi:GH24 family phage-related lysozyme (muramidase)
LLSLVINRGNSLTHSTNDSRMEMEQISDDLKSEQPEKIPSRLRAMKRLWEGKRGLGGLVSRRESEAKLFERGLKCDCYR